MTHELREAVRQNRVMRELVIAGEKYIQAMNPIPQSPEQVAAAVEYNKAVKAFNGLSVDAEVEF